MNMISDRKFSQFSKLRLMKLALRKKDRGVVASATIKATAFVVSAVGQGTTLAVSNPSSH